MVIQVPTGQFFAGGQARGQQARGQLGVQQAQVGIQQESLELSQQKQQEAQFKGLADNARKNAQLIEEDIKGVLVELKKAEALPDDNPNKVKIITALQSAVSRAVATGGENLERVQGLTGIDLRLEGARLQKLGRKISGIRLREEAGIAGAITGEVKVAEAEVTGVPLVTPKIAPVRQLQLDRDKAVAEGRPDDAAEIQVKIDATVKFDPREQVLAGIDPESIKIAVADLNESSESLAILTETARLFIETPEAGGIAGLLITNVGGLIEQIPVIGKALLDTAGINTAEVTTARTSAIVNTSRLLTTITGEESGRFTAAERAIADEALKTLKPTASGPQIAAALEAVGSIISGSRNRSIQKLLNASGADLSTDEGINAFGKILVQNGVAQDEAVEIITALVRQR